MNAILDLPLHHFREVLRAAIAEARNAAEPNKHLMARLEERCGWAQPEFMAILGAAVKMPVLKMKDLHCATPAFDLLPYPEALQHECVLLRESGNDTYVLAIANPFNDHLRAWAEERLPCAFTWHLVHHLELSAYLSSQEETMRAMDAMLDQVARETGTDNTIQDLSITTINADSSTVVKLVNSTLYDALKVGASDVHIETVRGAMNIRYRIDGVLATVGAIQGAEQVEQVISRIKVMSELDIAERRIPQDGRFKVSIQGREIDIRVSVMPSVFGEDAVLRILDKQSLSDQVRGLRLENLGFNESSLATLRRLCSEPYGMVLVTGPTGSGKTTSLYAAVTEINNGRDKIITIEDPVEYQLQGVLQIPVNEKKGLTFARGLRSILRHDPDKILVGEIRDPETAQIAVQAALTGHLVFTTIHANNVFDVISRFLHMAVDPHSFVSALNGIMAQRLVRLNCKHCSEAAIPGPQLLTDSGLAEQDARDYDFRAGRGCGHCRGTGYRGRSAIAEMLVLDDQLREMIAAREPARRIKETARSKGTRVLREVALDLVRTGKTSLQEINRVTFVA